MAGFRELGSVPLRIEYFRGVRDALRAAGRSDVFITEASPYATSEVRAKELKVQIEEILRRTGAAKVNLVGHSQGGLDARVLASPAGLAMGPQIASVVTVSTPHRGSSIADLALKVVPGGPVDDVINSFLQFLQRTVYDLTSDSNLRAQVTQLSVQRMREFNARFINAKGVLYESYAGRSNLRTGIGVCDDGAARNEPLKLNAVGPALLGTAIFLERGLPPDVNDGMVSVASSKWGRFVQCIPADHFDEAGLGNITFDHIAFYKSVAERIRNLGN
jgi:triacylglycerol lipase